MSRWWNSSLAQNEGTGMLYSSSRYTATTTGSSTSRSSDHNFLTFLAVAQFHRVDIVPLTWQFALDSAASAGTAKIYESRLNVNRGFVFKRTRIVDSTDHGRQDAWLDIQTYNAIVSEISVLCHPVLRQHPCIVKMRGISWEVSAEGDGVWPVIVLDKAQSGDLDYFMRTEAGNELSVEKRFDLCADIASAISALHSCKGVHGDIKPLNVFISICPHGKLIAQLADFGWSFLLNDGDKDAVFYMAKSPPWSAPEYHHRGFSLEQGQKQDVFSFGMLCLWVLFQKELSTEARKFLSETNCPTSAAQQSNHIYVLLEKWKLEKRLQAVALDMVATKFNNKRKHILSQLFTCTLANDPNERERHFGRLQNLFQQLDPKKVFSPFPQSPPICPSLSSIYPYFRILDNFFQFIEADYRLRKHLASCIEEYANAISRDHIHYVYTVFQLAFCYHLGFGVSRNAETAKYWIQQSGQPVEDLEEQISLIRLSKSPRSFRSDDLVSLRDQGFLNSHPPLTQSRTSENWNSERSVLIREIEDMAIILGKVHIAVQRLQHTLSHRYQQEGLFKDAEAIQSGQIEALFDESEVGNICRNPEPLRALTTQISTLKPPSLLAIQAPQSVDLSPLLKKIGLFVGKKNHMIAVAIGNLINILMHQARWYEAEWLSLQLREVFICLDGEQHWNTLYSTYKLGYTYDKQGRSKEAEAIYLYVLNVSRHSLGEEHWQTLQVSEALAELYHASGYHWKHTDELLTPQLTAQLKMSKSSEPERFSQLRKSATLEEQVLEVGRKMAESDGLEIWIIAGISSIAVMHHRQRRFREAEVLMAQLVEICKKGLPEDHTEIFSQQNTLATFLIQQNRWSEASRLLEEVTERSNRVLGKSAMISLDSASNLGATYVHLGLLNEGGSLMQDGGSLMQETVAAQKEVLGENHLKTLTTSINLAVYHKMCGDLEGGISLLEDTLERLKRVLGEENEYVFQSSENLAQFYLERRRYDDAETLVRSLVIRKEIVLGQRHPSYSETLLLLATCLTAQERLKDATPLVEQYSAITTQIFGEVSKEALNGLLYLGLAYYREERWEEGRNVYQDAVDKANAALGPQDGLTEAAVAQLAFGVVGKWPDR